MTQQTDPKGELRAASTMRELEKAQRSISTGPIGVFMRVTLAIIFMYLIFISHQMFGVTGPVFISVLFLVAVFVPVIYQAAKSFLDQRRVKTEERDCGEQAVARQEV